MRAEDTLQMMADFYPSIFPTRKHALDGLFCVIGNGFEWINGELVDNDDVYSKRYKLKHHIKKAEFPNEDRWWATYKSYKTLEKALGKKIDLAYEFSWYPLSRTYSPLFKAPDDIKPDWKALLEECKRLLIEDGIDLEKVGD